MYSGKQNGFVLLGIGFSCCRCSSDQLETSFVFHVLFYTLFICFRNREDHKDHVHNVIVSDKFQELQAGLLENVL